MNTASILRGDAGTLAVSLSDAGGHALLLAAVGALIAIAGCVLMLQHVRRVRARVRHPGQRGSS